MIDEFLKKEYDNLTSNIDQVVNIFTEYFGEDLVEVKSIPTLDSFVTYVKNLCLNRVLYENELNYSPRLINTYKNILENNSYAKLVECGEYFEELYIEARKYIYSNFIFDKLFSIIVYFPQVTVTNESNASIIIYDTFVCTDIYMNCTLYGGPKFTRSTYTDKQWKADYLHSHVQGIRSGDYLGEFQGCCTGSGPLAMLKDILHNKYSYEHWYSYCFELDRYIKTESISGGPYRYINDVYNTVNTKKIIIRPRLDNLTLYDIMGNYGIAAVAEFKNMMESFLLWFIDQNVLKFNYNYNRYGLASSIEDFTILFTNKFIEWYNTIYIYTTNPISYNYLKNTLLIPVYYKNFNFYEINRNNFRNTSPAPIGKTIITFKDKIFNFKIIENHTEEAASTYILHPIIISLFLGRIITIININYGKSSTGISNTRII